MILPSVSINLDVAQVQAGFVVHCTIGHGAGSVPTTRIVYLRNREELQAWLANMEIKF